jgi:myo-inositol-1(or 4)-monophosphatase
VADGRAELFFECRLSPWDFAAGSLVVTEAGGRVTTLEGQPLDVLRPGSVFATNGLCHELLRDMP